ncbi:MAG: carboxypeptidase-like regulatory domain-containing protein [Thermoanaerobaculaceae bacterium]
MPDPVADAVALGPHRVLEQPTTIPRQCWRWGESRGRQGRVCLDPGAQVQVSVRDRQTQQPAPEARVELSGHGQTNRSLACTTNRQGSCTIATVPPGSFRVWEQAAGRAGRRQPLVVPQGQKLVPALVELACGVWIRGWVRGLEDYPGEELEVRVSAPGFGAQQAPVAPVESMRLWPLPLATSPASCNFLPPGIYALQVRPCRGAEYGQQLTLMPGNTPQVVIL